MLCRRPGALWRPWPTHRIRNVLGKKERAGVRQVPDRSSPVSAKWIQKQQDLGWWRKQIRQFGERRVLSNTAWGWLNLCSPLSQSASQDIVSNCPWVSAPQHWIFRTIRPIKAAHPDHLSPRYSLVDLLHCVLDKRFEMCLKELAFTWHLSAVETRKCDWWPNATNVSGSNDCPHNPDHPCWFENNEIDRLGY